jgi:hypothetical protein
VLHRMHGCNRSDSMRWAFWNQRGALRDWGRYRPAGASRSCNLNVRPLSDSRDLLDLILQVDGAQFRVEINSDTSLLAETGAGGCSASERELVFHAG